MAVKLVQIRVIVIFVHKESIYKMEIVQVVLEDALFALIIKIVLNARKIIG
jgi:hypothetical protein